MPFLCIPNYKKLWLWSLICISIVIITCAMQCYMTLMHIKHLSSISYTITWYLSQYYVIATSVLTLFIDITSKGTCPSCRCLPYTCLPYPVPVLPYPTPVYLIPSLFLFYLPYPIPIPTLPCRTENGCRRDVRDKEAITRKP